MVVSNIKSDLILKVLNFVIRNIWNDNIRKSRVFPGNSLLW